MILKTKLTNARFLKVVGYLFLVMVAATALTLAYYNQAARNLKGKNSPETIPTVRHNPVALVKTYSDPDSGVSFQYPKDLKEIQPTSSIYPYRFYMKEGQIKAALAVPGEDYSGTNLNQAYAVVAVRENARESDCKKYWDGSQAGTLDKDYLTGTGNFAYRLVTEAAAGTRYETRIYHLYRHNNCYEINLNLSYANIQNYPDGAIIPLDQESVWKRMVLIVSSFKLNDKTETAGNGSKEEDKTEGQFCGGIAGKACPSGYACKYDGSYPDAGGYCTKEQAPKEQSKTAPSANPASSRMPARDSGTACIQVITAAQNPATGEVRDFPTPCDVPQGWEVQPGGPQL